MRRLARLDAIAAERYARGMMRRTTMALALIALCVSALGCGGPQQPTLPGVELRGNRIVLADRIQFAHDSDRILEESHPILDRVVTLLEHHDEIVRVQVQGHSSTDGNARHNQRLSERRAASVATYLREHGVTQEVTSQGYGPTYPLCSEDSDDCHQQNRRVEFFVDLRR